MVKLNYYIAFSVFALVVSIFLTGCIKKSEDSEADGVLYFEIIDFLSNENLISEKNIPIVDSYLSRVLLKKDQMLNFSGTIVNVTCELIDLSDKLSITFDHSPLGLKADEVKQALSKTVLSSEFPTALYGDCLETFRVELEGVKRPRRIN